jgi:hypothetical protein
MQTPIDRLIEYWRATGVYFRLGTSEQDIHEFEIIHGVILPHDFRDYVRHVGGMVSTGHLDDEMFSFWPLESMKNVAEDFYIPINMEQPQSYFVFADWMIGSQHYAIRLTPKPSDISPIVWMCEQCYVVADSFSEFLQAYLDDRESIIAPKELR